MLKSPIVVPLLDAAALGDPVDEAKDDNEALW